ncbi:glycosyltransferase family 2 protein [Rhodobacteraceae bacterium W635]|uniref:glycosyltransferase family 2 protein n=1 Tax=Nioella halotolerans TaxID=2303578 RepID=UPI000E3C7B12|nr:glycosyltransferase family 2 protein [Rhodobacteraceae bacterium W635]
MISHHGDKVVLSAMRNEGMFLLEWIAYYRAIGFDKAVIVTNNCTDGTDLMLDRLEQMGYARHLRNDWRGAGRPQMESLRIAREDVDDLVAAEWCLHVDSDEFLNVTCGGGHVDDLLDLMPPTEAIAIAWRPFGNNGHAKWPGGLVIENFTRARAEPAWNTCLHKSMFKARKFSTISIHMPKHPTQPKVRQHNTRGTAITTDSLFKPAHERHRKMERAELTWDNAQINHYTIRSDDTFLMKNDRGTGNSKELGRHFMHSLFYQRLNRNDVEETSILRLVPRVREELEKLREDPILHHLEQAALHWFLDRRDRILTPEQIAEWTAPPEDEGMAEAAE